MIPYLQKLEFWLNKTLKNRERSRLADMHDVIKEVPAFSHVVG